MDTVLRARFRQAIWVILIVAYAAAFVVGVVGVSAFPSTGVTYEVSGSELVMAEFEPGSHVWTDGARPGDIVELLNGRPAVEVFNAGERIETVTYRPAGSQPGEDLNELQVRKPAGTLITQAVGLNIVAISLVVMAVLIYLRATRTTDTMMFTMMAMTVATGITVGIASVANHPWGRVSMGPALNVAAVTFLGFFFSFTRSVVSDEGEAKPGRGIEVSGWKAWLPEITVALSVVVGLPWVLVPLGIGDLYPVLRQLMLAFMVIALLGSLGLLGYRLRTADRENQERLRIVTLGMVIGLIPVVWLSIIPLLVTGSEILPGEIAVISFVLIPLSFGYAIARHDLMGIRRLFHRGAAYAIITAAIIIVYGTILTILNLLAPDSDALGPIQGALLVLMFAGAPTLSSVRRTALRIVDRVIFEGAVTIEDLVNAISTVSANETEAGGALARALSFTGQGFEVEYAAIVSFSQRGNEESAKVEHTYNSPTPDILERVASVGRMEARGARRSILPGTNQTILLGMIREVRGEPRMIVLGPRVSEEIFTDDDIELLNTVCAVVSTALTRIRLLDEVEQQNEQLKTMGTEMQNIQELERQEISAYLHDEPLQKLAFLNSRMSEMDIDEDLKRLMAEVVRDLRGTSAGLSPEMLRSHGLMSALKWMVQDQQQRGPFKVFLEIRGIDEDERLHDDIELTIYRAAQEALNNCRKHAQAKTVWVTLTKDETQLELSVKDNGVGIKASTEAQGERSPDQGLGIRGLKQRVTNLGGTLAILPRSSRGTEFLVKIPISQFEEAAS